MTKKKKVGILGGSFDPVHWGHLNLAIGLMESCALDEVIFVPTSLSPFKQHAPSHVSANHRLAMLKLAIAPIPAFKIFEREIHLQETAYTIDTVRILSQDTSKEWHLLLGDDHLETFHKWKEADELLRLAPPLVGSREGKKTGELARFHHVKIPIFEISSTVIRERLAKKKYCGHLVPAAVLEYINNYQLYS